jgi:hypothetical protein
MSNEVYCKIFHHNIRCLTQSRYESQVAPEFLPQTVESVMAAVSWRAQAGLI